MLTSAPNLDLVAVVTTNPDRRALVAADLPGVAVVPDLFRLKELGVTAVTITTPPATHAELAHQAMDLGLAVVLDKPFALDAAEAASLLAHSRQADLMLTPYQNRRWDSDFRTVQKLIDDGSLGPVHRFVSRIDRFRPVKAGWAASSAAGGGTLLDLGPHLVDQTLHLFGPVARLHAQIRAVRAGSATDDELELHLEHVGGVFSTISAAMASAAEGPRFQVNGSVGGYLVTGFDIQEQQLKAGESPLSLGQDWGVEPEASWGTLTTAAGSRTVPSERGRWDSFYPAAAAAVLGQGKPPVDPADAVHTSVILDAARVSAREHTVVELR